MLQDLVSLVVPVAVDLDIVVVDTLAVAVDIVVVVVVDTYMAVVVLVVPVVEAFRTLDVVDLQLVGGDVVLGARIVLGGVAETAVAFLGSEVAGTAVAVLLDEVVGIVDLQRLEGVVAGTAASVVVAKVQDLNRKDSAVMAQQQPHSLQE